MNPTVCSPFDPQDCVAIAQDLLNGASGMAQGMAQDAASGIFTELNSQLHAGIKTMMTMLAGWMLVPSTELCPASNAATTGWMATCNTANSPAVMLRAWTLPVTILVAVLGLLWQAIAMTITRKGEPLIQAMRGLVTTGLWGAVGIIGTQLALRASDDYTFWILRQAVFGDSANPQDTLGTALSNMSPTESYNTLVALIVFNLPILFISVIQIILMIFREGSVVILAGLLQLAAAGSFTRLTAGWLPKVTGWMLALICYKPIAASVYATAFALMGADGARNSLMGLAVLLLSLIAMPATMKFFNWTVGSLASGASTLGMLGTAAAAGVHAASSLRGIGGYHVGDQASYMDEHGPGSASPAPGGRPTSPGPMGAESGSTSAAASGSGTASGSGASATGATSAATTGAWAAGAAATGGISLAAQAGADAIGKVGRSVNDAANTASDAMQGR